MHQLLGRCTEAFQPLVTMCLFSCLLSNVSMFNMFLSPASADAAPLLMIVAAGYAWCFACFWIGEHLKTQVRGMGE